ncbi:MAG TPA: hypothetical protein VKU62_06735 [Thermoanaerobaculia bacterium]|nr:hypothetical protein [Thermoanaerobaculia bacterium]
MVGRVWSAVADVENAKKYVRFFERTIVPQLAAIDGSRGALVMNRRAGERVEINVLTFWDSTAAIEKFAGSDLEAAIVEPEAQALLHSFDDRVRHYDVATNALAL